MLYNDTIDDSRQYLRLALELIGKFSLPTNPLNYCVWYEYVSDKNPDLKVSIDAYLQDNTNFTEEFSHQLYDNFIAGSREELKELFVEIISAIQTTDKHFSSSENNLERINQSLIPGLSEADVDRIVEKIKVEIESLEKSSCSFKEQLQQATREIDQLKSKMAQYRKEAIRDPLTHIANRRGFEERLNQAIEAARKKELPLSMIMADIDHFKQVNDNHGHLVGDNVLRRVAATFKDSVKGRDLVTHRRRGIRHPPSGYPVRWSREAGGDDAAFLRTPGPEKEKHRRKPGNNHALFRRSQLQNQRVRRQFHGTGR